MTTLEMLALSTVSDLKAIGLKMGASLSIIRMVKTEQVSYSTRLLTFSYTCITFVAFLRPKRKG